MNPTAFLFSCTLVLVPACSGSTDLSTTTDAGGDAAPEASSASNASDAAPSMADGGADAAQACNALANTAASITVDQVAADPPAPQGGTIVDGTYAMTSAIIYTGAGGPAGSSGSGQTTLQITGDTIQVATSGQPASRTVTFTTSGTAIDSVDTCPDTDARPATYTATATTFVIELPAGTDDAGARTLVETFTKQ